MERTGALGEQVADLGQHLEPAQDELRAALDRPGRYGVAEADDVEGDGDFGAESGFAEAGFAESGFAESGLAESGLAFFGPWAAARESVR